MKNGGMKQLQTECPPSQASDGQAWFSRPKKSELKIKCPIFNLCQLETISTFANSF